ncbi:DNA polymerase III subunit gamma and tau, partial [Glaciibacter sp. 2TAF33]|uniref:DNA polymerase III subunit gamma and tau n=1 Tax=Glaciibacter sp. 2TAF33 TaxID=3233015 RepID=UPI003F8EAA18
MIGQSQVTEPLMTALRTNRVNHAYLFSGPRGCGKTTSARILARCLNCVEGPTDTPCGVCPSCVELSRDGSGSLDVVEIDAASHNGVDDARDIRERAIFAPARDRYKIFILDEAHMVTPQGFNALLKIVEEPPEHIKFIFATTEPEKVIGTIRSRTHHYPFRLVPPAQMLEYAQTLCDSEGITVAPGVLPLVVRAGGGSPRDTLSLLDQLMAGSDDKSVEYERAVALLGYTHASLLDDAVDAIAARDSAGAFDAVDRVIQTGQDPRRFVEDLLERMRDLIIVAATSATGAAAVLRGVPQDELDRMAVQAAKFGPTELSRTADILNAALTEMTGATSPRLHLELMVARALIPGSDDSTRGALARVERLERRIGVAGNTEATTDAGMRPTAPVAASESEVPAGRGSAGQPAPGSVTPGASGAWPTVTPPTSAAAGAPAAQPASAAQPAEPASVGRPAQPAQPASAAQAAPPASASTPEPARSSASPAAAPEAAGHGTEPGGISPAAPATPVGPVTLQQIKDAWPLVLEAVKAAKMNAWLVVFTASLLELRGDDVLVISFPNEADYTRFKQPHPTEKGVSEFLREAIIDVLGLRVKFIAKVDAGPTDPAPGQPAVRIGSPTPADETSTGPTGGSPADAASSSGGSTPGSGAVAVTSGSPGVGSGVAAATGRPSAVTGRPGAAAGTPTASSGSSAVTGQPGAPTGTPTASSGSSAVTGRPGAPTGTPTGTAPTATTGTSTGWATVAIPGSATATMEAPDPEPPFDEEPPFDDVPPPFDDDVPPDIEAVFSEPSAAPSTDSSGWATSAPAEPEPWAPSAASAGPTKAAPAATTARDAAAPTPGATPAAATPAGATPAAATPARPAATR